MARPKKKDNTPENFPKKHWKKLPATWTDDSAQSKSTEDLNKQILASAQTIATQEKEMAENETVQAAKERLKDLTLGYKEVIDMENAITKYCLYLKNLRSGDE